MRLAFAAGREDSPKTLPDFDVGQLEDALIADSEQDDPFLRDLHIRLLRGLIGRNDVTYLTAAHVFTCD